MVRAEIGTEKRLNIFILKTFNLFRARICSMASISTAKKRIASRGRYK
jgi:hypothetical protein